jgi:hypothetical protein
MSHGAEPIGYRAHSTSAANWSEDPQFLFQGLERALICSSLLSTEGFIG